VNRTKDAEAVIDKALKKNPRDLDALLQRGAMFLAAKDYRSAEADLTEVLRLKPDSADVHYALAKVHQARGARPSYRQELSETLRINPLLLSVRFEMARDFITDNKAKAALDLLSETPDPQKDLPSVIAQRNWAHWALGDLPAMRKGIDQGLARDRTQDLLIQDGLWKLRSGKTPAARTSLEEALKLDPADVRALTALKDSYLIQKQTAQALQKIKEFADRQPKSAPVQEFYGTLLMASGDRQGARAAFETARSADPKFVRAGLSLTQLDIVEGKFDDAQKRLEAMLTTGADFSLVRLWLGNLKVTKGDNKAAIEEFRRVAAADPRNTQALNNLAYLLAETAGKHEEALKYAQQALEVSPESGEYRDTLGWILYRKGLYSSAVKELELAAAKEAKQDALWHYHLAMAYTKAGDLNRGRATLQTALKRNPNLPEAQLAMQMIGTDGKTIR
jgi:Tfp pilus assembly protein PilF